MEDIIPCSMENQEVFQRVWQRVMADRDDADCPIGLIPADLQGDLSCECLETLMRQDGAAPQGSTPPECLRQGGTPVPDAADMPQEPAPPAEAEAPPAGPGPADAGQPVQTPPPAQEQTVPDVLPAANRPCRGSDMPQLWETSQEASDRTTHLRRQVMEALEGWQFYRHLARRARGNDARTLNSMAGDLHRQARKLSAAYFLLTGLRYWPSELLGAPLIPSYWGAMRQRHQTEQRQETAFHTAADDWDDPDLLELYKELIEGCQARRRQLMALLEQDGT